MIPGRFTRRPFEVEAVRVGGKVQRLEIIDWLNEGLKEIYARKAVPESFSERIAVDTKHGWVRPFEGDWIVRIGGQTTVCDDKLFKLTHEEVK